MSADGPPSGPMPEAVRTRLIAFTAEALPDVTELPASLRKVATFAPARRARLGATQIAAALEADDGFRVRVATQVAAAMPDLAEAIRADTVPQAANPVEVAVQLWLQRPDGWAESYATATRAIESSEVPQDNERVTRLEARLEAAEKAAKQARHTHKAHLDELKTENTSLRRKLGEARASLRASTADSEQAVAAAQELRAGAESARAGAEAETRRLRAQLEESQATLAAARRGTRNDRDEATLRARLLLDTLVEAGQGLRRELALPAVTGSPGDRVEAEVADAGSRTPSAAGAMGPSSPALLDQLLAMPRARLIIDGYNVSKTAWPDSTLEAQRIRLLNALAPLVARTGAETTVVFDAASQTTRGVANAPRGVKVLFSPEGVIADDVIRQLVAAEPVGRAVVVVTSDQEIIVDVRRSGARAMWSPALLGLIAR